MIRALLFLLFLVPPPDSTEVLTESVVTAFRQPEKIIPAQTLQGEQLEKLNALSVADAIRYFSGVQIKDYGGIGGLKTINVRSMGTQHVGVFKTGRSIWASIRSRTWSP